MKKHIVLIMLTACLLGLVACSQQTQGDVVGVYVYEKSGFGGVFTITIEDDGTFYYSEGLLSSYLGKGSWTLDGDILHLWDTGLQTETRNYYFQVDGSDLVFISENSDNFTYLDVREGERFLTLVAE